MAKINIKNFDQTLSLVDKKIEEEQKNNRIKRHLGMSQIGEECWRKLFYSYRNAEIRTITVSGIKAIQDGYLQEDIMSKRLQMIPEIILYTKNPENQMEQISFSLLLGHLKGYCDGIIKGIIEAPQTWHIWEHKSINEKKFNELKKIREEKGEKEALYNWDIIYYAQAQLYMHESKLERHFLTASTPGGRDHISVRTNYNKSYAENLIIKAKTIIFNNTIPARLSEKREFYKCKWCEFLEICHDGKFPLVNCKTCRYIEPVKDGQFFCHKKENIIENFDSCNFHIYNPSLINSKLLEHQEDGCIYKSGNLIWANIYLTGMPDIKSDIRNINEIYTSRLLRDKIQYVSSIK